METLVPLGHLRSPGDTALPETLLSPARPRPGLTSLPEELLENVLKDLVPVQYDTSSARALRSLCLTSRLFRRLSTPYLYTWIDIGSAVPESFFQSLTYNPDLSGYIKHVYCNTENIRNAPKDTSLGLTQQLREKFIGLNLNLPDFYVNELFNNTLLWHFTALFILAPNLETCHYRAPGWKNSRASIFQLLTALPSRRPDGLLGISEDGFRQLHTIRIDTGSSLTFNHVARLLGHTSLRTLEIREAVTHEWAAMQDGEFASLLPPHRSSFVENLYLPNCGMSSEDIAVVLGRLKHLRRFSFGYNNPYRFISDETELHWPTIAAALLGHGDSLEAIRLYDYELRHGVGYLGSLKDLGGLRYLSVPITSIEPNGASEMAYANLVDTVPSGIEYLCIHRIRHTPESIGYFEQSLETLADDGFYLFPSLRHVHTNDMYQPSESVVELYNCHGKQLSSHSPKSTTCGKGDIDREQPSPTYFHKISQQFFFSTRCCSED
ncbi:hypothetical protein BS50DRAFT_398383 [Corynespora cassiicola Philippines]|uniref:F-box domain-containing protein n=1 Tax=Corynespora cassiicola Philippines TaxID=1448308 RepID=A0A2T2NK57_CORCC|nr:hypothetical protein BS50DRAFT_398383 [Corynespora cassiicola Philippines]